ncbi:MAG: hypothetical protein J7L62_03710 [Candidatus Aminicenantes bacterium]|nr:hypothetical protein [Candidatus Aminicenantes bacterium]
MKRKTMVLSLILALLFLVNLYGDCNHMKCVPEYVVECDVWGSSCVPFYGYFCGYRAFLLKCYDASGNPHYFSICVGRECGGPIPVAPIKMSCSGYDFTLKKWKKCILPSYLSRERVYKRELLKNEGGR